MKNTNQDELRSTLYRCEARLKRKSPKRRWVPFNGDVAGLVVRATDTRDAWWSPAGFNRCEARQWRGDGDASSYFS